MSIDCAPLLVYNKNMDKLSVIFIGTGEFGVKTLNSLSEDKRIRIPFVVTGEDKAAGRDLQVRASPIKEAALLNKLIIQQSSHIGELKQKIRQEKPDFLLVVSYGEIIDESILKLPKYGAINIHGSLLPKYRGASPIQESLLRGDSTTGITWILMTKKMDAGNIIAQSEVKIQTTDTYVTLAKKLEEISANETAGVLRSYAQTMKSIPQESLKATYCRKITKKDGLIDLHTETAEEIVRKTKAYFPWPGCYLMLNGKRLKIIQAGIGEQNICSGETQILNSKLLAIGTRKGALIPLRVQPESKREMSIEEFLRGQKTISF